MDNETSLTCRQLTDRLLAIDNTDPVYRNLKADALSQPALRPETATVRKYHNSVAAELRKGEKLTLPEKPSQ